MIEAFLQSWPLFHDTYIAGVLIALLLSLVGVSVVARDQVFLGAAVSQASLLGIAAGILLDSVAAGTPFAWMASDATHSVLGGVAAVLGSLAVAGAAPWLRETREALTGWLFLAGSSLAVLLVSGTPHGMAEVNRLLASTLLGANEGDVGFVALLLVATVLVVATRLRPLLLLLTDPETAEASGIAVQRWERWMAVWLGLAVAWSIHVAGVVFTFGCLVLPAMVGKALARNVASLVVAAPLVALVASSASFVVANAKDLPPGQVTVAMLCGMQVAAWALGRLPRSR